MSVRESAGRSGRCLGVAFAACATAPIVALLVRARLQGTAFGGSFTPFGGGDGFRYLAWVRDAGKHGLIGDPLGGPPSGRVSFNPLILLSGLAWRAGLSLQVAFLLWLPVAVWVVYRGSTAYIARCLPADGWARPAALALALFYVTPLLPLLDWGGFVDALGANYLVIGADGLSAYWRTWGHPPAAMALGLLPVLLLRVEQSLAGDGASVRLATAVALVMTLLHPWAGITALGVLVGLLAWDRGARARASALAPVLAGLVLPLVYELLLARAGPAWTLARLPGNLGLGAPLATAAALVPLALFGVLALRGRNLDVQERMLRLWPASAVLAYGVLGSGSGWGALPGTALPLAVLTVRGWPRLRIRAPAGAVGLALLTLPGFVYSAQTYLDAVRGTGVPFTVSDDQRGALAALREASGAKPSSRRHRSPRPPRPSPAGRHGSARRRSTRAGSPTPRSRWPSVAWASSWFPAADPVRTSRGHCERPASRQSASGASRSSGGPRRRAPD